jgi:hypothetical protein
MKTKSKNKIFYKAPYLTIEDEQQQSSLNDLVR